MSANFDKLYIDIQLSAGLFNARGKQGFSNAYI